MIHLIQKLFPLILNLPDKKPAEKLMKPLNKAGVRVYVITTGDDTNKDDYKDVVPDEDNAKHVPNPGDITDVVPSIIDKIKKDIKERKHLVSSIISHSVYSQRSY